MATNEILRFAETDTGTNLLTQAEYLADSQRPIGNQPGVARSKLVNKALRQASLIAAGLAEYIADNQANNITDALTPQNIADYLQAAITGALGVTPPQFDNDTSLATTAFVQRALGNMSGQSGYAVNSSIPASRVGNLITFSATGLTLTLPSTSDVPTGSVLVIYGNSFGGTVAKAAGDTLQNGTAGPVSSFTVGAHDKVFLISIASAGWYVIGGEVALKTSSAMAASIAASGYQKLPSGLIIQWGNNSSISTTPVTITFPITFPNAMLTVVGIDADPASISAMACNAVNASSFTATAASGTQSIRWIALGH